MLKKLTTILNNISFLIKFLYEIKVVDGTIHIPSTVKIVVDGDIKLNTSKEKPTGEINRIYLNCD